MSEQAYTRQLSIFDPDNFNQYKIGIIGCGSIGSYLGITLSKLGMKKFRIIDNDKINEHNLSNQFFTREDIGEYKVDVLKNEMNRVNPDGQVLEIGEKKRRFIIKDLIGLNIVFCCVDKMDARKRIFNKCVKNKHRNGYPKLFIDTRMGGEIFEVYTINLLNKEDVKMYRQSLFSDKNAEQTPCTARSIIYNVLAVSSIAVAQMVKVFNNVLYRNCITGDLVNMWLK